VSFETAIVLLNVVVVAAIGGLILFRVVSLRRNPEPRSPLNLAPGLPDDVLEGRKLERVLGWALLFTLVLAVSVPVYFLVEPTREADANTQFLKQSVARGARLFANQQSKAYDATFSLLCANCHGVDASGGQAPFVLQPEADICQAKANQNNPAVPQCLSQQVSWQAPPLNTVLLRFDPDQVAQIITYGRPGTPMPPWGVASGKGVLGPQGIDDLVNYLQSIQLSQTKAQQQATAAIAQYKKDATTLVSDTQTNLTTAQSAVAAAQARGAAPATVAALQVNVTQLQAELASAQTNNTQVQGLSEGAVLFRLNCARCHTKNWSFADPTKLNQPQPARQGSGAFGPPLTDGTVVLQFPGAAGRDQQLAWVSAGVPANQQFGVRGISSGRMPHFGKILSANQISEIVNYERNL
jgi:mono/diheme cytochrome c family protein